MGSARIAGAAFTSLLLIPVPTSAQDVTEPVLKAAFIYNFAKFTEWPAWAMPDAEPLVMCVVGDTAVGDALERAVQGRVLGGRAMAVSNVTPAAPRGACHVLYVSGVTAAQAAQLIAELRDVAVLTISDIARFTELGGIAEFFFDHGQLRFRVHVESAKRAHLQISSRLLELARRR